MYCCGRTKALNLSPFSTLSTVPYIETQIHKDRCWKPVDRFHHWWLCSTWLMCSCSQQNYFFGVCFYLGKQTKMHFILGWLSFYSLCLTLKHTHARARTQLHMHTQQGGSGLIILTLHRSPLSFSIICYRCIFLHVTAAIAVLSFCFSLIVLTLLAFYLISASSPIKMYENGFFRTSRCLDYSYIMSLIWYYRLAWLNCCLFLTLTYIYSACQKLF